MIFIVGIESNWGSMAIRFKISLERSYFCGIDINETILANEALVE
jgi:hypothetical protein